MSQLNLGTLLLNFFASYVSHQIVVDVDHSIEDQDYEGHEVEAVEPHVSHSPTGAGPLPDLVVSILFMSQILEQSLKLQ